MTKGRAQAGRLPHPLWLCWGPVLCAPAEGGLLRLCWLIWSCVLHSHDCRNSCCSSGFCLLWCLHDVQATME